MEAARAALEKTKLVQARSRAGEDVGYTSGEGEEEDDDDLEQPEPDEGDDYWTEERVTLPRLPAPHVHAKNLGDQEPLEETDDRLFDKGGPLEGKKRAFFPISKISEDATSYEIYEDGARVPVPKRHRRERFFQLALVHRLGYPDQARGREVCGPERKCFPDGVYRDMRLAFECDEEQHLDPNHRFNRFKPKYQVPRDRAVNEAYTREGYYMVRVIACTRDTVSRELKFRPLPPLEVYKLTVEAVDKVLEARKRFYAAGDFGGKVVVIALQTDPEYNPTAVYAHEYYNVHVINREAARHAPTDDLGRAKLRGAIMAQELAMIEAEKFLRRQEARRSSVPPLPSTSAARASLSQLFSSNLRIGPSIAVGGCYPPGQGASSSSPSSSSRYEKRWNSLLASYDAEAQYQERLARMESDLKRVAAY